MLPQAQTPTAYTPRTPEERRRRVTYKLLALDLDGTLLGGDLIIALPVAQAIAAAQARGVHVTIATGRMFGATLPYAVQLNIHGPLICFQGAVIRDTHSREIYQHWRLDPTLAAEAAGLLRAAGIFTLAYIDERLWVAEQRAELHEYLSWHPEHPAVVLVPDLARAIAEGGAHPLLMHAASPHDQPANGMATADAPTKLLFIADAAVAERETARLARHFAGRLAVFRSHARFGEVTGLGISKGTALAALAARLGIAREEVIAIGDHENDIPMIEWAGLGLAMGNGIPAVHAAAAAVIPPVSEHGVAWAIERYILGSG